MEKKYTKDDNKKERVHEIKPTIWIGKSGISDTVIKEIQSQLKKKKTIKVKILKSALDEKTKEEICAEIVEKTHAEIIQKTGFILALKKGAKKSE